jgi:hypothetical protein
MRASCCWRVESRGTGSGRGSEVAGVASGSAMEFTVVSGLGVGG